MFLLLKKFLKFIDLFNKRGKKIEFWNFYICIKDNKYKFLVNNLE